MLVPEARDQPAAAGVDLLDARRGVAAGADGGDLAVGDQHVDRAHGRDVAVDERARGARRAAAGRSRADASGRPGPGLAVAPVRWPGRGRQRVRAARRGRRRRRATPSATDEDRRAAAARRSTPREPVPAADPASRSRSVRPDPDDPTLEPGDRAAHGPADPASTCRAAHRGRSSACRCRSGGTSRSRGPTRWQFIVPGNDALAYGLRVDILADTGRSVEAAKQSRESRARLGEAQGSFSDLEIDRGHQRRLHRAATSQDGYQRFSIERFYPGPDPDQAFATVAVYGRAPRRHRARRPARADLDRRCSSAEPTQSP